MFCRLILGRLGKETIAKGEHGPHVKVRLDGSIPIRFQIQPDATTGIFTCLSKGTASLLCVRRFAAFFIAYLLPFCIGLQTVLNATSSLCAFARSPR